MGQNNNAMASVKIKNNKSLTGFTLVEILVTIGIMTILFTIAALNLNTRKPGVLVENAAREFLSQLAFAKNLALTGAVFRDEDIPADGQLDVPFGYGLFFWYDGSNQYVIFGDLYGVNPVGNKKYDNGEKTNWGDFIVDDKVNVEFTSSDPTDPAVLYPMDPVGIFFETLNGHIYYHYNDILQDEVIEIQVKFSYVNDPSITQTVIINKNTNQIYLLEQ